MELNQRQFSQESLFDPGEREDPAIRSAEHQGRIASRFGDLRTEMSRFAAEGVLETGDIRNQHETRDSGGFYDPGYRDRIEREGLEYTDNPVYGYLATDPSERSEYGDVIMTMKPSVKERATLYPDDSWYAFEEHETAVQHAIEDEEEPPTLARPRPFLDGVPRRGYYLPEAHIHMGDPADDLRRSPYGVPGEPSQPSARVPLEDVSRVTFDLPRRRDTDMTLPDDHERRYQDDIAQRERQAIFRTADRFAAAGPSVEFSEVEELHQPPLPYNNVELTSQGFTKNLGSWERRPVNASPYSPPENSRMNKRRTLYDDMER